MTTVGDIVAQLDERFPQQLTESWDNTGLLLGCTDKPAVRVMTALTLTEDVAEEAVAKSVDLIVTHHPILFRGAKQLTTRSPEGRIVLTLAKAEIAVFSPHTRFDSAADGINQFLAIQLGLTNIQPLRPTSDDVTLGSGRFGEVPGGHSVKEFAASVSRVCEVDGLHIVDSGRPEIRKVAIACGAAGEFLSDAITLGCDAFLVGECRFHTALEAKAAGVSLFVPGHYASERPAVEELAKSLSQLFPGVESFASQTDTDPLSWITAGKANG